MQGTIHEHSHHASAGWLLQIRLAQPPTPEHRASTHLQATAHGPWGDQELEVSFWRWAPQLRKWNLALTTPTNLDWIQCTSLTLTFQD